MNTKQAIKNVADVPNKFYTSGGTFTGDVTMANNKRIITANNHGLMGKLSNGNSDYLLYMGADDRVKLSYNNRAVDILANEVKINNNQIWHSGNFDPNSKANASHRHDNYLNRGNWDTNSGQDLLVHGKRALVGMTNGELHLGYGGDFSSIKCGNGHTVWHSGNFNPDSKSNNHDHPYIPTSASCNKNWNWSGQGGQPSWVWGGNDPNNMYVYNPSNFSVNYANSSNWANGSANADKIGGKRITVSQSAPGNPATGDIWISW